MFFLMKGKIHQAHHYPIKENIMKTKHERKPYLHVHESRPEVQGEAEDYLTDFRRDLLLSGYEKCFNVINTKAKNSSDTHIVLFPFEVLRVNDLLTQRKSHLLTLRQSLT